MDGEQQDNAEDDEDLDDSVREGWLVLCSDPDQALTVFGISNSGQMGAWPMETEELAIAKVRELRELLDEDGLEDCRLHILHIDHEGYMDFLDLEDEVPEPEPEPRLSEDYVRAMQGALASAVIEELHLRRHETEQLRGAIGRAGFAVMQTSGEWSIHDISQKHKFDEQKTDEVINQNIDLEQRVKELEESLARVNGCNDELTARLTETSGVLKDVWDELCPVSLSRIGTYKAEELSRGYHRAMRPLSVPEQVSEVAAKQLS